MSETQKQKILIVDDHPTNVLVLRKILEKEWDVQSAPDGLTALQVANEKPVPDIILLDVKMPDIDGYEVCRRLKKSPDTCDIPLIFVTSLREMKEEAYGLGLGAVDYIIKPVNGSIVKARVRNHIALQQARKELTLKNKALEQLAIRDNLTGLYNRRKLDESFAQEVARSDRYNRPLSVIMLDIDYFKAVNDTHGHHVGDAVLVQTAEILLATLRTSDIPGRWGGEEFLIICPETPLDITVKLAERLRLNYESHDFHEAGRLTASFGVSTHHKGTHAKDIFLSADAALYRAKNGGRNRVESEIQKSE